MRRPTSQINISLWVPLIIDPRGSVTRHYICWYLRSRSKSGLPTCRYGLGPDIPEGALRRIFHRGRLLHLLRDMPPLLTTYSVSL